MLVSSSVAEEKKTGISAAVRDTISTAGVHTYTENNKRFALFFLLNGQQNLNLWRVTPESLPKYMDTFIGMPFIEDPGEGHFGIDEDTLTSEILSEQEDYRKGTIVDVSYDPKLVEAVAVVEITNDDLWQRIQSGATIHVSPAITGRPIVYSDGSKTYDMWYGLHLARVKNPAYGVMHASLQKTCQGSEQQCIKQMTAMASTNNCSFVPYPEIASCSSMDQDKKKDENETAKLKADIAALTQSVADLQASMTATSNNNNITQPDAVRPGEKQVPSKGNEDDNEDNDKKETAKLKSQVAELTAKIAETEEKEKKEMAQEITDLMVKDEVAAEEDKESDQEELMKNDKASLTEKLSIAQKYHAVAESKSDRAPGLASSPNRIVSLASAENDNNNNVLSYEDTMRMLP